MTHMTRVAARLIGGLLALTLLAAGAKAQDGLGMDAFYGTWQGSAVSESEVSIHFRLTSRDIGVEIEPVDAKSFKMKWFTVQRQKGDPNAPTERLKETKVTFVNKKGTGLWVSTEGRDPLTGETLRWVRIDGNALIVNSFVVRNDGSSELQTYRRELTDIGMDLTFTRTIDGELVRTAKGRLVKIAR